MLSFFSFYSIGTLEGIARSTRYLSSFSQGQVPNITLELLILLPFSLFLVFSALCLLLCRSHPWQTSLICWTYNLLPVSNDCRLPGNRSEIISIVPVYSSCITIIAAWAKSSFAVERFPIAGTNFRLQDTLTTRYPKKTKIHVDGG